MGFQEVEHTGDCAIRVWADDLPGLFVSAARGFYQLSGSSLGAAQRVQRRITLSATDIEGLLVAFLGELIYWQEQENLGFDAFDIQIRANRLTGAMMGGKVIAIAKPLKAVTYHGLRIRCSGGACSCEVVFDA